jgi:hypothetical protein
MYVALFKKVCQWFLADQETNDGVFGHCFLLLTWNLGCRVNNTTNIRLQDIMWANNFDCFHILFAHSKTDLTGDNSQYPRHIFANPSDPIVCPVLSLAMYFLLALVVGIRLPKMPLYSLVQLKSTDSVDF